MVGGRFKKEKSFKETWINALKDHSVVYFTRASQVQVVLASSGLHAGQTAYDTGIGLFLGNVSGTHPIYWVVGSFLTFSYLIQKDIK